MIRNTKSGVLILGLALLAACAREAPIPAAPGELPLAAAESKIWFIGIKNNAVAVPGFFGRLSGSLSVVERRAHVEVMLASLDTGLAERDTNIRVHFFEAKQFRLARLTIDRFSGAEALPPVGGFFDGEAIGTLEIHGQRVELSIPVRITREGAGRVRVTTTRPFVLTADELGLSQQLATLKAVCGHEALSGAVPVEVDLVFEAGA